MLEILYEVDQELGLLAGVGDELGLQHRLLVGGHQPLDLALVGVMLGFVCVDFGDDTLEHQF